MFYVTNLRESIVSFYWQGIQINFLVVKLSIYRKEMMGSYALVIGGIEFSVIG